MSSLTCVATEVITTHQKAVGYAYRTAPATPTDSGWRFLSGSESEKYMNQPTHYITCVLVDFALEHPEVVPLLDYPVARPSSAPARAGHSKRCRWNKSTANRGIVAAGPGYKDAAGPTHPKGRIRCKTRGTSKT